MVNHRDTPYGEGLHYSKDEPKPNAALIVAYALLASIVFLCAVYMLSTAIDFPIRWTTSGSLLHEKLTSIVTGSNS